jgi:hypothetical protein
VDLAASTSLPGSNISNGSACLGVDHSYPFCPDRSIWAAKACSAATTNWLSSKGALLLVAYLLVAMPVVLFVLSHLIVPVFVPRYLLPCGVGVAIILADFADASGADSQASSGWAWGSILLLLVISPVATVLALPPLELSRQYLDVQRLDHAASADRPVVAGWQEDFSKLMRFSHDPARYYFLLDWPANGAKGVCPRLPSYEGLPG